ncbi:MAG: BadF/BadG/BcrA/BcrD ATPase family protein [Pirellulales bacterium]
MSAHAPSAAELLLAVDAGGSKTAACFARRAGGDGFQILGRGRSTGANPLSIGVEGAIGAVAAAVATARQEARLDMAIADRAVLSIAGAADPAVASGLVDRLREINVARRIAIVTDVLPVFAAASEEGAGIALICGTGSVAFGRNAAGTEVRCGGWGYLLGDEGSGYAIGRAALRAALVDLESSQPSPRRLTATLLDRLNAHDAKGLKTTLYNAANPRAAIAAVAADVVLLAANDDPLAREILAAAGVELASLAQNTAHQLGFAATEFPIAMAGGVLVASEFLRACVERELKALHLNCRPKVVDDPLVGCLKLAVAEASDDLVRWQ